MKTYFDVDKVYEILSQHMTKIVTVIFDKRSTGEERTLNGHLSTRKHTKGIGMSYVAKDHDLMVIYDLQVAAKLPEDQKAKAYRSLSCDSVKEIHAGGKVYRP